MTALLLVHGAWHGAWCWRNFVDRLTAAGHDVHTVDLRGHGESRGLDGKRLPHRIHHYVDDVAAAVQRIGAPVVLVGHSMGTLVVAKYLERQPDEVLAGVLLAPVPPRGATASTLRFASRHPLAFLKANLGWRLGPVVGTPTLAREMLFTPATTESIVDETFAQLQDESYLAYLDMMIFALPRPRRFRVPVLVLGGALDRIFLPREVRAMGRACGIEAEIFPEMGHNLMQDEGWSTVADRVDEWVHGLGS